MFLKHARLENVLRNIVYLRKSDLSKKLETKRVKSLRIRTSLESSTTLKILRALKEEEHRNVLEVKATTPADSTVSSFWSVDSPKTF